MKVVYLAGPYRATTPNEMHCFQEVARWHAVRIWQMGAACICPHLNSRMMDGSADDTVFLAGYLELVRRSDALVLLPLWYYSEGATAEKIQAEAQGIPVFDPVIRDFMQQLERWVRQ